jgi:hypothetical protein
VRVSRRGVITAISLAPTNVNDLDMAKEVLEGATGWALADHNYWSPDLMADLQTHGIGLLARWSSKIFRPYPRRLLLYPHSIIAAAFRRLAQ